ncbi:hypothetical protein L596_004777 [Steinernema carpocapsae]|uniref:Uncharacterized protein n=1 Tax=Steinernema carpocapsae TaxID=34508 RepID=A0A4U8UWX8_STECR|nr:hypothetical protein L596_004777 [Steinernema carpocapsae]
MIKLAWYKAGDLEEHPIVKKKNRPVVMDRLRRTVPAANYLVASWMFFCFHVRNHSLSARDYAVAIPSRSIGPKAFTRAPTNKMKLFDP